MQATQDSQMSPDQIKARAKQIRDSEEIISLDLDKQIKKAWRILRPQMWARLQQQGITDDLALVLQVAMWEATDRYEKAGMPPTDAREQAEREFLLMEPEKDQPEISLT